MNHTSNKTRWTDETVIQEAKILIRQKCSDQVVSHTLGVPLSTVNWHMRVRLKRLNGTLYYRVRILKERNRRKGGRRK